MAGLRFGQYLRVWQQYIGGDPTLPTPGGVSVFAVGFTTIGQMYRATVADGSIAGPSAFIDDGLGDVAMNTTPVVVGGNIRSLTLTGVGTAVDSRAQLGFVSLLAAPAAAATLGAINFSLPSNGGASSMLTVAALSDGVGPTQFGARILFSLRKDNGGTTINFAQFSQSGISSFGTAFSTPTFSLGTAGMAVVSGAQANAAADATGWFICRSGKTGAAANNDVCGVFATLAPLASTTVFTSVFTTTLSNGPAPFGATLTYQNMRAGALRTAFQVNQDGTFNHSPAVSAAIVLAPFGVGAGQTSTLQFLNLASTQTVAFKAPDAVSGGSITFVWPPNTGSWSGQVMRVDGLSPTATMTVDWAGIAFARYTQQQASGGAPSEAGAPPTNASFVNPRTLTTLVNDPYALLTIGLPSASFAFSAVGTYRVRVRASVAKSAALTTICATKLRLRDTTAGTTAIVGAQKSIDSSAVGIVSDYVELDGYVTVTVGNLADTYAIQQWFNDGTGTDATSWGTALTTGETEQYVQLDVTKVL